jgi:hypothetical protein
MEDILPGRVYAHHKGGRYLVLGVADESTNARIGGRGVVYVSLAYGTIKYRDLKEFVEEVRWPDGIVRSRFIPEEA